MKRSVVKSKSPGLKDKKIKARMKTIHAHDKSSTQSRQAKKDSR